MKNTITITSKGQTTLPAPIRRKLGLDEAGGVLQFSYDERRGALIISKSISATELSNRLTGYIKSGVQPVVNVDDYYQTHRRNQT